ncbi:MAG: hypothetical protein MSG64_17605 [Pyrinomonadaceae bacterium MAG19_C2-C3]|nr:hypothetical protein [Pyrinomonadaceae bacterium MAG19_C2-C3]
MRNILLVALFTTTVTIGCSSQAPISNTVTNDETTKLREENDRLRAQLTSAPIAAPPMPIAPPITSDPDALREITKSIDPQITYSHLIKNPDRYKGQPWAFSGRVLQITELEGKTTALIMLDPYGQKNVYVIADFITDFVENNQVYVVGYISGSHSYTSQANYNLTVPLITASAIVKPSERTKLTGAKTKKG